MPQLLMLNKSIWTLSIRQYKVCRHQSWDLRIVQFNAWKLVCKVGRGALKFVLRRLNVLIVQKIFSKWKNRRTFNQAVQLSNLPHFFFFHEICNPLAVVDAVVIVGGGVAIVVVYMLLQWCLPQAVLTWTECFEIVLKVFPINVWAFY